MERIEKIRQMLEENPADNFLQHALALELIKIGNDSEAESLFRNILDKEPGYTGSYYHLAKLLERNNRIDEAILVYEQGMEQTKNAGDQHAYGELKGAYEELTF